MIPLLKIVATIMPIINGRDSTGSSIYLGPHTTKVAKYLLIVFLAKSLEVFRLGLAKEIDSSVYFTM
jgi:hypothetical protein